VALKNCPSAVFFPEWVAQPQAERAGHRKMKLIQRRAYGFRNFQNYRLRVIAQCG
jgi:hypothetical protein